MGLQLSTVGCTMYMYVAQLEGCLPAEFPRVCQYNSKQWLLLFSLQLILSVYPYIVDYWENLVLFISIWFILKVYPFLFDNLRVARVEEVLLNTFMLWLMIHADLMRAEKKKAGNKLFHLWRALSWWFCACQGCRSRTSEQICNVAILYMVTRVKVWVRSDGINQYVRLTVHTHVL